MTRLPAEWEPHERTVMCWPTRTDLWGPLLDRAEHAHADVANAIAAFEPVTMLAPAHLAERAARHCASGVDVDEFPIDDSWFRDTGPIYVVDDDGRRVATDWEFNGWGDKFDPYDNDAAAARRFATLAGHPVHSIDMVLEGGAITSDGDGTIVTTTQCLMHPNRNPSMTKSQIERTLSDELGADRVIWLPYGLSLDGDTDGHVDNVAAFAGRGRLVLQGCNDADEADRARMDINRRSAAGASDADGNRIATLVVPVLPFVEVGGRRVAVPYLNYYVGNGFVAVPTSGHDADDDMVALIAEQYPHRTALAIDVGAVLAFGGGGIHCITQQLPAVTPGRPN
ncbi:MAG: agmatine deiminase family protein [Ilumatobacter sp.]|nr:agmatine deiminase family protein [Ilumatobacter sp.]